MIQKKNKRAGEYGPPGPLHLRVGHVPLKDVAGGGLRSVKVVGLSQAWGGHKPPMPETAKANVDKSQSCDQGGQKHGARRASAKSETQATREGQRGEGTWVEVDTTKISVRTTQSGDGPLLRGEGQKTDPAQ